MPYTLTIKELTADKHGHEKWIVKERTEYTDRHNMLTAFKISILQLAEKQISAWTPISITASEGKTIYGTFSIR